MKSAVTDRQRYMPRRMSPARMAEADATPWMTQREDKAGDGELLGLSVLSALSVAGIHSAINPSYFTLRSFASKPEGRKAAVEGLWIGLGAGTVTSGAIWLVFKEWVPALVSQIVAVALFGVGYYAATAEPLESIPPIQEQTTTEAPQGA